MEVKSNKQLPFLDVPVERDVDKFKTSVYRKATHTGRYLHYDSNHHISVKIGVARCLYDRAKTICSREKNLRTENKRIADTLMANGYPKNKASSNLMREHRPTSTKVEADGTAKQERTAVIPYFPGVSDQLRRIGSRFNIRTAFKTSRTLRELIIKTKPENEDQKTKNCVYEVPCEC